MPSIYPCCHKTSTECLCSVYFPILYNCHILSEKMDGHSKLDIQFISGLSIVDAVFSLSHFTAFITSDNHTGLDSIRILPLYHIHKVWPVQRFHFIGHEGSTVHRMSCTNWFSIFYYYYFHSVGETSLGALLPIHCLLQSACGNIKFSISSSRASNSSNMPLSDPENDIQCKNYPVYNHPLGVIKTERRTKKSGEAEIFGIVYFF